MKTPVCGASLSHLEDPTVNVWTLRYLNILDLNFSEFVLNVFKFRIHQGQTLLLLKTFLREDIEIIKVNTIEKDLLKVEIYPSKKLD